MLWKIKKGFYVWYCCSDSYFHVWTISSPEIAVWLYYITISFQSFQSKPIRNGIVLWGMIGSLQSPEHGRPKHSLIGPQGLSLLVPHCLLRFPAPLRSFARSAELICSLGRLWDYTEPSASVCFWKVIASKSHSGKKKDKRWIVKKKKLHYWKIREKAEAGNLPESYALACFTRSDADSSFFRWSLALLIIGMSTSLFILGIA